jgi:hypothetical protein
VFIPGQTYQASRIFVELSLDWSTRKVLQSSRLRALLENIRLGWKGLPDTLAYY